MLKARQDPMVDLTDQTYWTLGKQSWREWNRDTELGARFERPRANADNRNDQPGLALPALQNDRLALTLSKHSYRARAAQLKRESISRRSLPQHAEATQTQSNLATIHYNADTPPHKPRPSVYLAKSLAKQSCTWAAQARGCLAHSHCNLGGGFFRRPALGFPIACASNSKTFGSGTEDIISGLVRAC